MRPYYPTRQSLVPILKKKDSIRPSGPVPAVAVAPHGRSSWHVPVVAAAVPPRPGAGEARHGRPRRRRCCACVGCSVKRCSESPGWAGCTEEGLAQLQAPQLEAAESMASTTLEQGLRLRLPSLSSAQGRRHKHADETEPGRRTCELDMLQHYAGVLLLGAGSSPPRPAWMCGSVCERERG